MSNNTRGIASDYSGFVINLSFVIRISSLQSRQSRYAEPASDPAHLRLGEPLALFNGLFHSAQDNFLEKFDVVWIDHLLIDLNREDVSRAICSHFHFAAARAHFDDFLFEFSLRFGHLLLHLLRLFHELVQIHKLWVTLLSFRAESRNLSFLKLNSERSFGHQFQSDELIRSTSAKILSLEF